MELVAMAYGGCTGMDVISILRKKKQDVHDLEMIIRAEKAEKHPKRYTDIHIEFVVRGRGIDEAAVKRAIELSSDKYCAVGATLKPNANITNSYRIEEI
jgi:putative redox protein